MKQITIILAGAIAAFGIACKGGTGSSGGAGFSDFSASGEISALQGKWEVKDSFASKSTWEVSGSSVKRTKDGKTESGKLVFAYPGKIKFVQGSSSTYYGYSRNGKDIYLGLGTGGAKIGSNYYVGDSQGFVKFDGKICTYHKKSMFGGTMKTTTVKCSIKKTGDDEVLSYEIPDSFKKGKMRSKSINVIGSAIVNHQMKGNLIKKM